MEYNVYDIQPEGRHVFVVVLCDIFLLNMQ